MFNLKLFFNPFKNVFIIKWISSIKDAWLISWHHILNVDESILSSVHLEEFKGLLNQVSKIVCLSLTIINFVSQVVVTCFEKVHDWQNLSVIWNKCFTDSIRTCNKTLQNLEGDSNNLWVSSVEGGLDWDDQLRNNWQYLGTSLLKHIEYSLDCEESIWINLLPNTFKENRQVVMII